MKECLYSRNTLTSLTKLLIAQDYDKYIKEMTRRDLDWRNPLGEETYNCFRHICVMEKNMLKVAKDNGGFSTAQATSNPPNGGSAVLPKNKAKGVFTSFEFSDPESEDEVSAQAIAGHSN